MSRQIGIVSPSYGVYRPRMSSSFVPRFLDYLLRTEVYRAEYVRASRGITTSRLRLYPQDFLGIPFVQPPIEEQRLIARFLDTRGALTARLIRAKQRLIKLLEEQKQAIIHGAVTRGLDPNVRLRPSGVPWLGDVPEHWVLVKLRHCGRIVGGMTPSMAEPGYWDGDLPWITPKDMKQAAVNSSQLKISERALRDTSLRIVPAGAVLLVVRGMILARFVPIAETTAPVTINQDMKAITPDEIVQPSYLVRLLSSSQSAFASLIDEAGHGTRRLPTERWRELLFAFPPRQEQTQILGHLSEATAELDRVINAAEREVVLLREFRNRLVADVVTGKLDVRTAASALPEITEADPMDEPIDGEDLEEVIEDVENEAVAA